MNSTYSEVLIWTCRSCGHSFQGKEWDSAGQRCPACEREPGLWKCSLCQQSFSQKAAAESHPCLQGGSSNIFSTANLTRQLPRMACFGVVGLLVFLGILSGIAAYLKKSGKPESPASAIPLVQQDLNTSQSETGHEEVACSEGLVRGIVYDPDGPVKLRKDPRSDAEILRTINSGSEVIFRDIEGEWKETFLDDDEMIYYVHQNRLFARAENIDPDPPTYIRGHPEYGTAVVGEVGKDVPIYAQFNLQPWVFVVAGSRTNGFVHGYVWHQLIQDPRLSR